jgi:hypothetical protein
MDRLRNSVVSTGRTTLMLFKENPTRVGECFGMAADASDDLLSSLHCLNRAPASSSSTGFDQRPVHEQALLCQEVGLF